MDNETVDGYNLDHIENIRNTVRDNNYNPQPVRRIDIPKSKDKTRPLGLTTIKDRIVQEVLRLQIEAIYEPKFSKWSFGFRPGKSCHDAVKRFQQRFNGIDYYIKIDLEDFFRNVNHDILNKILSRDITKHKVVKIIDTMVKSGIMRNHIKTPTYSGVPQGGIISPILSNIVLNEFDKFMEKKILPVIQKEANINSEYSNIVSKISRLKKKRRDNQNKEKLNKLIEKFKTLKRYSRRPLSVE